MRVTSKMVAIWVVCIIFMSAANSPGSQQAGSANLPDTDSLHLHPGINGQSYKDDKIRVEALAGWHLLFLVNKTGSGGSYQGAMLTKGRYVLRLCTGCRQTIGVSSGGFSEIAPLIQPQYRADFVSLPTPCGEMQRVQVSKELERQDFWFRRDPAHRYNEAENDCREPSTTDTVWYGSYFSERCPDSGKIKNCGGYYLHHDYLTKHRPLVDDEMLFVLSYDTPDVNQLPHQNDPQLQQILKEASAIIRSIRFVKSPR